MQCHFSHMLGLADQINSASDPSAELRAALVILLSMVKSADPVEVSSAVEKAMIEYRSKALN
mgnify:CR=1 FL=1